MRHAGTDGQRMDDDGTDDWTDGQRTPPTTTGRTERGYSFIYDFYTGPLLQNGTSKWFLEVAWFLRVFLSFSSFRTVLRQIIKEFLLDLIAP